MGVLFLYFINDFQPAIQINALIKLEALEVQTIARDCCRGIQKEHSDSSLTIS
jgi:hypothetical protein